MRTFQSKENTWKENRSGGDDYKKRTSLLWRGAKYQLGRCTTWGGGIGRVVGCKFVDIWITDSIEAKVSTKILVQWARAMKAFRWWWCVIALCVVHPVSTRPTNIFEKVKLRPNSTPNIFSGIIELQENGGCGGFQAQIPNCTVFIGMAA